MKFNNQIILAIFTVLFLGCKEKPLLELNNSVEDISFIRNDSTLISSFTVSFSETGFEQEIVKSIMFVPNFSFTTKWESGTLIIEPQEVLEELTQYKLCIGDDSVLHRKVFNFLTGPYSYLTTDVIIKPSYWIKTYRLEPDSLISVYYPGIGWQSNCVTSSQFAIFSYEDYIRTGNENSKKLFFRQVREFCSTYHVFKGTVAYPYQFAYVGFPAGWYSGLAQGQVLSVLVRAFVLTNDENYLNLALKIADFMFISVDEGGVFQSTPEGYEWIEEYPTTPPSYVWNGFVFAVMGLIDLHKVCPSEKLSKHIAQCIMAIKNTIDIYDTGSQLHYGRGSWDGLCDLRYKGIQTHQCKHLYYATKDPFFYNIYVKWFQYFDYNAFISIYN